MRRLCLVLLLALCLLAPETALGQGGSAGDQQYVDPLASGTTSTSTQTPTTATTPTSASAPATTPTPPSATPSAAPPATPTAADAPAATLPRTGFPTSLAAALGVLAVAAGAGLRRAARPAS